MSLVLRQIKTQELVGGTERRQPILGFYVLVHLVTAIQTTKSVFKLQLLTFIISLKKLDTKFGMRIYIYY